MTEHKELCLSINRAQSVKRKKEKATTEFKNCLKKIPVSFKIYANFVCNLKSVESYKGSFSKKYKITFLVVLLTNFFVEMINLSSK